MWSKRLMPMTSPASAIRFATLMSSGLGSGSPNGWLCPTMMPAVLSNPAGIIVGHNHPLGDPEPSPEDINVAKRIAEAGEVMGISLLDHIVPGDETFVSLKGKGHM